jgi:hypothetical protein
MKHILLACFAAVAVIVLQSLTGIVPAAYQPFVAVAVAYFTHYYLENAPAGAPALNPSAPANGPPASPSTSTSTTASPSA